MPCINCQHAFSKFLPLVILLPEHNWKYLAYSFLVVFGVIPPCFGLDLYQ